MIRYIMTFATKPLHIKTMFDVVAIVVMRLGLAGLVALLTPIWPHQLT